MKRPRLLLASLAWTNALVAGVNSLRQESRFHHYESSMAALWEGYDLHATSRSQMQSGVGDDFQATSPESGSEKLVLLGPMDSGTHLLNWVLETNFPQEHAASCQPTPRGCKWIWKHGVGVDDIVKVLKSSIGEDLTNTNILAIVRSPFANIVGWQKDPWDMEECANRPWSVMDEPCSARLGPTLPDDHIGLATDKVPDLNFSSTVDVFDQYFAQYARLKQSGLFKNVIVVRYEDLLLAPTALTAHLGSVFGWPEPSQVRVARSGVKGADWAKSGRKLAIENLRRRSYMHAVPSEALSTLCRLLSETTIGKLDFAAMSQAEDAGDDLSMEPQYGFECSSTRFKVV